jgi:hypothetical protein
MRRNSRQTCKIGLPSVTRRKPQNFILMFKTSTREVLMKFCSIPPFFNSFLLQIAQLGVFMVPTPSVSPTGEPEGEGTITPPSGCVCKTSKEGLRNNNTPDEETPR